MDPGGAEAVAIVRHVHRRVMEQVDERGALESQELVPGAPLRALEKTAMGQRRALAHSGLPRGQQQFLENGGIDIGHVAAGGGR